jgi:hypothetical protein
MTSKFSNHNQVIKERQSISLARNISVKILFALCFSLLFVLIDWESLLGYSFPDKINFLDRFDYLQSRGPGSINPLGGLVGAYLSESVWGQILYWFGIYGFSGEQSLNFISFVCLFFITFFVLGRTNAAVSALFLINPLVVDFVMAQQRSALGFVGFLFFIHSDKQWRKYSILAFSLFIHSSVILMVAGYYFSCALAKIKFGNRAYVNNIFYLSVALIVALFILLSKELVLTALNDRRAVGLEGSSSFLFLTFWAGLATYFVLFSKFRADWMLNFALLFTSLFLVAGILNLYNTRYLVLALPFLIISLVSLPSRYSAVGCYMLFGYQSVQWIYYLGFFTR